MSQRCENTISHLGLICRLNCYQLFSKHFNFFYFHIPHSGPPMIASFGPNPTNVTEKQQAQFECYGHGLPLPSFSITKVKPAPGMIYGLLTRREVEMVVYRSRHDWSLNKELSPCQSMNEASMHPS